MDENGSRGHPFNAGKKAKTTTACYNRHVKNLSVLTGRQTSHRTTDAAVLLDDVEETFINRVK